MSMNELGIAAMVSEPARCFQFEPYVIDGEK